MSLTRSQRMAGQAFLDACQARLPEADILVPVWVHHYRHECEARRRLSWTLPLVEHYIRSPEYWVCYCSAVGLLGESFPHDDCQGGKVTAEAGLFAYHWRQGRCRGCGVTARSREGALVFAAERPPLLGSVVEEFVAKAHS
jgi:hypothetical protein